MTRPQFTRELITDRMVDLFLTRLPQDRNSSECWEWSGPVGPFGHGKWMIYRPPWRWHIGAHRFSYMHFVGNIPDGIFVCHHCDNARCCNPDHLFLGTALDNSEDMVAKGRTPHGSQMPNAKLTEDDVREIRSMYRVREPGRTIPDLAERYGVSTALIYNIVSGKKWRHVK